MNIKELFKRTASPYLIPVEQIEVEAGFNFRDMTSDLNSYIDDLARYIENNGVPGGPLVVKIKGDKAYLRDGHCRLAAVKLARSRGCEIETVQCRVMNNVSNDADEIALLVTSNSGRTITQLELAGIVKRLHLLNIEDADIARKIGKSPSLVHHLLVLSSAPEPVKEMVKAGRVSASMAVGAVQKNPDKAAETLGKAYKNATDSGKKKATPKHLEAKLSVVEKVQAIIRKLSKENFSEVWDWMNEEAERRANNAK
jgi:ParB family chromosome partitioning protein